MVYHTVSVTDKQTEKMADMEQLRYLNTLIEDTLKCCNYYTKDYVDREKTTI